MGPRDGSRGDSRGEGGKEMVLPLSGGGHEGSRI